MERRFIFMKKYKVDNKGKLENVPDGFAEIYSVELYMKEEPIILENKLLENIKKYCGNVEVISNKDNNITFAFMDYILEFKNASAPVSIIVSKIYDKPNINKLEKSLEQSSNSIKKGEIQKCSYRIVVTDIMAIGVDYRKRMEIFQKTLYAIVELIPCEGIHFHITEQVISRGDYLENNPLDTNYDPLFGILNVRTFNIKDKKDEYLMDTLGLSAIGLCDLQCHFEDLNPNKIIDILYSYGYYIFDNSDAADNLKEIESVNEGEKWKCEYEISIAEPKRVVIDINPGKKFSGVGRN
jgi:hypothetical protein